ncbi:MULTISPECIES: heparinase II/III family protein [unclassified Aliiroseovarius]|uniref:heparinase II/III family protein n=1 Tax=unclassified Aliiroseovarius TaxID=2623558 RepID=UPI001569A5FC|nr:MULTISPECIES: heparinase II/III family protein [unclassified Aliiroseovarius]NRP30874.1 Heparin-sulfate lyase [Aliiroseovarius sp. xm-m-314]NRP80516.1 Heparin-sulfate lyase [Aliiroseovarius sp. xm-v-209]
MQSLLRYWHTLRHLRPVQIYGRVWFRLARPKPDFASAPPKRAIAGPWVQPAARTASVTGPDTFIFLGQAGSLGENGWDDPAKAKLWRYNQHYFDDLNAEGAETRRDWHIGLIARWIAENPPGVGTGWEPYPVSLRIVNLVKFALSGGTLDATAHQSLAIQARWLMKRLEWHLLGNHLFANAKALLFAGLYFDGQEARGWRRRAVSILSRELPEQILPDGGQFELTPMYHALAVEDVADIVNLTNAFGTVLDTAETRLARACKDRLPAMLRWLDAMTHPDGGISFFNDAAFGVAPGNDRLHDYSARLGIEAQILPDTGLMHLSESGFARMARGEAVVLCDIGRIGPDYLPGHAHADTLSFELSLAGTRVIVNSGTSEYGLAGERLRQRGTAAHSTVVVAETDSSEVWSGFRVARRARVDAIETTETPEALTVGARHDGYTRLPDGPRHSRRWTLTETGLRINDRLDPATPGEARFHLPPGVSAEIRKADPAADAEPTGLLHLPSGRRLRWRAHQATARVDATTWHPRFGESQPCTCLALTFTGNTTFELDWT